MYKKIIFIFLLLSGLILQAQQTTQVVKVRGNCEICKNNIETAVKEIQGASGDWNMETKELTVTYDAATTNIDKILRKVAEKGYDNEKYLAEDSDYNKLPSCCHYDRDSSWEKYMAEASAQSHEGGAAHPINPTTGVVEDHHHDDLDLENQDHFDDDGFDDLDDFDAVDLSAANISNRLATSAMDKKSAGLQFNISDQELLKAACCNLSESFETNATVDVSFTNAVSGTKQLRMLGLDQKYILLTKELLPEIRGISSAYGLNFIPGRWIESIQLVKGAGSVTNGYESISGHINTELYKSSDKEKTSLNFYGDNMTRFEGNFVHVDKINDKWGQSILLNGNAVIERMDTNDDHFMDLPIGRAINMSYLLSFNDLEKSGLGSHFGVNYVNDHRLGGQTNFIERLDKLTTNSYGIGVDTQRFQFWNKTGYIFKGRPYQSLGWMNQYTYHEQNAYYGLRTYDATQKTYYSNLIFESILGTTAHKYKTGLSFLYDHYDELYNNTSFKRTETVPGAFFEYTYVGDKLTVVAGSRLDFHNLAGTQFTPRLNLKYDLAPKTILRASVGRGFRTANIFAESQSYFASNRQVEIIDGGGNIYGLNPEIAWNYGLSLSQEFRIFGKKSSLVADFFRTDFENQVVLDLDDSPQKIMFYNLDGKSYANSFQVQWDFEPARRLDVRMAYKYYDTRTDFLSGSRELPFVAKNRGFLNLAYSTLKNTKSQQWSFDTTLQYVGKQRLPESTSNPAEFQFPEYGNSFFLLNAQVARNFNKNIRMYIGGENLLSYTQDNPIIDAKNPFGNYFDGGMVYAPIMPAVIYIGLDIDF